MKQILCLVMLLLCVVALPGCQSNVKNTEVTESTAPTEPVPITTPKNVCYSDNIFGIYPGISVYPASNHKGFYYVRHDTNQYEYHSLQDGVSFQMCSRAGCKHKDESCPGYITGLKMILEANNIVYVFCSDGISAWLMEVNPATEERVTIAEWEGQVGEYHFEPESCFYSTGHIYVSVNRVEGLSTSMLQCVDLEEKTVTTIAESGSSGSGDFLGAYGDFAFVDWYGLSEELPTLEKYLEEHPDDDEFDYYFYINQFQKEHTKAHIRKYNIKTGDYENVSGVFQGDSMETPTFTLTGSHVAFGKYLLYSLGSETIYRYNMETGEAQKLLSVKNLFGASMIDDRLLYWWKDGDQLKIRLRDLYTEEEFDIENKGDNQTHVFSIHAETATAFIGLYHHKKAWISKEHYYAQRYDCAVYYYIE